MGFAKARKAAGYSQSDVARFMGVSPAAVSQWETGVKMPNAGKLVKLAGLYCCTVDDLLRAEDGQGERTVS